MVKKNKKTKFEDMICPVCLHGVFMLTLKFIALLSLTAIAAIGVIMIREAKISEIDPIILWCFLATYVILIILIGAIFFYSKNRNIFESISGLFFLIFVITVEPQIQTFAINFGIAALILQILSAFSIDIKLKVNNVEESLSYWTHARNNIKRKRKVSQKGNKTK